MHPISKEDPKQQPGRHPPLIIDAAEAPAEHSTMRLPGALRYAPDSEVPSLPRDRPIGVRLDPNELASSHRQPRSSGRLSRHGFEGRYHRLLNLPGGTKEALSRHPRTWRAEASEPFLLNQAETASASRTPELIAARIRGDRAEQQLLARAGSRPRPADRL